MLRLKELRKQNRLTQQQLAEMLGVTQAALSGWENEKFGIDNGSLLKCAKIFDVSIDYLLGRQEQLPELNSKDKREIQEILDDTEQQLLSQDGLMFDGSPATDEDVQKIIMAMKMGMEMIKKENKAKFTPKKYRKNNWGIAYE